MIAALKKLTFLFIALFAALVLRAQTCDCYENLTALIKETETNYAGFPSKTAVNKAGYTNLKQTLLVKSKAVARYKTCFDILAAYVQFFKDKHFYITYYDVTDIDSVVVHPKSNTYFQQASLKKGFEGTWVNPDKNLTIGIEKKGNNYIGYKLEGTADAYPAGFVYFTLFAKNGKWYALDYNNRTSTSTPVKLYGNLLQFWDFNCWARADSTLLTKKEKKDFAQWKGFDKPVYFEQLNAQTGYLKIGTFSNTDAKIAQVAAENDAAIRKSEKLIIDLRGNSGGSTGWVSILPYIQTNDIYQPLASLRITRSNVAKKLPEIEPFAKGPVPDEYKKYFPESILRLYQIAFDTLQKMQTGFYQIPGAFFPNDQPANSIKKVILLVDEFCGSSTEYFLQLSKQSKKTIIAGTNTFGMMDYEGMSNGTDLPYSKFSVHIPITKSNWTDTAPIDAGGIQPKNRVPAGTVDWIKWAMQL